MPIIHYLYNLNWPWRKPQLNQQPPQESTKPPPEPEKPRLDQQPPRNPTELEKLQFDYAWKWFNFHADQRTKMFNFMLIGLGIFATAVAATIEKKLWLEAGALSSAAVLLAIAFLLLDGRNRHLYIVAMDVLIDAERGYVFAGRENLQTHDDKKAPFGIASRIAIQESKDPKGWRRVARSILEGRHRYLMPLVAFGFAALFALASAYSWLAWAKTPVMTPHSTPDAPFRTIAPDVIAVEGTGIIGGPHWLLIVTGLVVAAAGVVLYFRNKWVGSLLFLTGLATTLLPNLSIPLTAQFHFDPKFEAKLAEKIGIHFGRSEPAMLASGKFGGFGDGVELFDCNDVVNRKIVGQVNAGISRARERQLQAVVLLVGSTDRKPLSGGLRRRFESNAGLARARVAAVERCLDLAPSLTSLDSSRKPLFPEVIRLVTGPAYTPGSQESPDVVARKMAEDREVRAFIIGVPVRGSN